MALPTKTTVTDLETTLVLDNGVRIVSGGDRHLAGADVHVYDAEGNSLGYWDCAEWEEDAEQVMGAILRCAALQLKLDRF
jgi:hypothetical protein